MEKSERKKYYRLKALKESSMVFSIILILFVLVMKFDNSIFSVLLSNIGFKATIPILVLLFICYTVVYAVNYAYGEMDIKVKKDDLKSEQNYSFFISKINEVYTNSKFH